LVLEALASEGRPMSAGEIGKRIGLSRSSMFRVAYTLQHMGFVEEVPETKALKLGARVLNIGYAYLASQTLIEVARPELEALRDKTACRRILRSSTAARSSTCRASRRSRASCRR
jgi:DNA-binding IclR family transcriptional regulator